MGRRLCSTTITLRASSGPVVFTDDSAVVYHVGPGQTRAYAATDDFGKRTGTASTMDVAIRFTQWFSSDEISSGTVTAGPATVRASSDGVTPTVIVTCALTSTAISKVSDIFVHVVYLERHRKDHRGRQHQR